MIRDFEATDLATVKRLMQANGLPPECMPDMVIENHLGQKQQNPLFVVKRVYEYKNETALICFLKLRSELYFFIDHTIGTPEERWQMLKEFTEDMRQQAWKKGLDQMTAFVPPEVDKSFGKRMEDLGFVRGPWVPYSMNLK
jgi:hypothetical protein